MEPAISIAPENEQSGKWNAALFNLILYTKKDERSTYITTLANKVIEKFPARTLLITVDNARSTIETHIPENTTENDTIQITVGTAGEPIVPYLILPHLLSDLPVYLVWPQDPSLLPHPLKKFTNRFIFDSEVSKDLSTFAKTALLHYDPNGSDIADLNWARMESWRDLLSSTFYSEDNLHHLQKTKTLSITYNAASSPFFCHTKIQAIYLQAWLASRLGWEYQGSSKETFTYIRNGSLLTITLSPTEYPALSPGNITAMTLCTEDDVQFAFQRDLNFPHQISLEITTPEQCFLPTQFVFAKGEAGGSLVKEVSHRGTSLHYLDVLKLLTKIKGLC